MSIDISASNGLFSDFNDDERKMVAVAVRRAEELEETRRITAILASQAQGIEADLKARGITDSNALREAAEAVSATTGAQNQLTSEVQDYRKLFGPDSKAAAAVGQYVQLLRTAHGGDVDALNVVQAARRELYEAQDASAHPRDKATDLSSLAPYETNPENNLFAGFSGDETKSIIAAVRHVDELEEIRQVNANLASTLQGTENGPKTGGSITDTQHQLTSQWQEYEQLFGLSVEAVAAVSHYAALLRTAHAGDLDSLNVVQTSRRSLHEAPDVEIEAPQQPQQRYEVRSIDPATLVTSTVLATDSALAAHEAFDNKADHEVFDHQSNRVVGTISWQQDGTGPTWKMRRDFAAAVVTEKSLGLNGDLINTVERDEPERTRPVEIEPQAEKQKVVARDDRMLKQDLSTALPESFIGRYVKSGDKLVDAANAKHVILVDKGTKLQVPSEFDTDSVKATVDVAETRGWASMKVRGSEKFRKAVYLEAASRGIEVKGYKPSEAELVWATSIAEKHGKVNTVMENDAVKAFRTANTPSERRKAAEQHPELKKAFAIEAAYTKLAKQLDGKSAQDAFMSRMRDNIATDLSQGRELVDVRLRKPLFKQQAYNRFQERNEDRGR